MTKMRIALYQGKSFISRLIRWQTRSQYSHAAFLLDDGSVIEAWQPCVREIVPAGLNRLSPMRHIAALSKQHTPGTTVDIFEFCAPLSRDENRMLEHFARREVGAPYDYASIIRFCTREKDRVYGKSKSVFCSELVFACCANIGRHLLERTEPWRVPPDWIARSPLLKHDETIVTV